MADPFATALTALHSAAGSVAAVYLAEGEAPISIRVIMSTPDREVQFHADRVIMDAVEFVIRRTDVAVPVEGDQIIVAAGNFVLQGEPVRDIEGLSWTIGAQAA